MSRGRATHPPGSGPAAFLRRVPGFTARLSGDVIAPRARMILLLAAAAFGAVGLQPVAHGQPAGEFARVNGKVISVQDYSMSLREEGRRRYYHSRPPDNELREFYRETADKLIARVLAVQEARRRGWRPDRPRIDAEINKARERIAQNRGNEPNQAFWDGLRRRLEEEELAARLQANVEASIKPDDKTLRAFYEAHPDKFTEPTRLRAAVILLKVDPSATPATWEAARDEAAGLFKRLRQGADFAELARLHSGDASAGKGGDMGYLHEGMLAKSVQEPLGKLEVGQISEPVTVLEGVAIFRLDERRPARRVDYAEARERVQALWIQQEKQRAWNTFINRLRALATVRINEKYLEPGSIPDHTSPPATVGRTTKQGSL